MKYITDFRAPSPTAPAVASSYVAATHKQRLATLQDTTIFPGVYMFNNKKHVKPIFFPKVVQTPGSLDLEDSEQELLLVHGSNDPSSFCPELLPLDVTKVALMLVKADTSVPDLFCLGSNKNVLPFTHMDISSVSPGFTAILLPKRSFPPSCPARLHTYPLWSRLNAPWPCQRGARGLF